MEKLEVKEAVKVEVQVAKKLLDVKELKEEMEKEKVEKAEAADKVAAWRSRICLAATYHRLVNDQGCRKTFSHGDSGFVADAHGHSYGTRFSTERDEGLGG